MTERTKQEIEAEARELMRQSRERRERGYASEADEKAAAAFDASWPTIAECWNEAARQRKQEDRRMRKFALPIVIIIVPLLLVLPQFVSLPMQIAISACLLLMGVLLVTEYAIRRIRDEG
jgi:hypothetical protein